MSDRSLILRLLRGLETGILAALLFGLLVIGVGQVIARDAFSGGFAWAEPLQRLFVFWLGLAGAVVAAGKFRHIKVDVLPRLTRGVWRRILHIFSCAFTAFIAALLAWHSGRLAWLDYEDGTSGILQWPAWVIEISMPIAFGVIALLYAAAVFMAPPREDAADDST